MLRDGGLEIRPTVDQWKRRLRKTSQTPSHSSAADHGQPATMQQIELNQFRSDFERASSRKTRSDLTCDTRGTGEPVPIFNTRQPADHQLVGLKYHHHLSVRVRNIRFH